MEAFFEAADSREVTIDGQTVEIVTKWCGFHSTDEAEVVQRAMTESPVIYRGMVRGAVRAMPQKGGVWFVEIPYRLLGPGQAADPSSAGLTPPGDGGGDDQPKGPTPDEALGPQYSFQLSANTVHVTQSKQTLYARSAADGVADVFGTAPTFNRAIGVTTDGVAGCDIITPGAKMVVKVGRPAITMRFIDQLLSLIGKTNDNFFYQRAPGEALYMGCNIGQQAGRWELAHEFGLSKNRAAVAIGNTPAGWQPGTHYKVGDQVSGPGGALSSTYVCTQEGDSAAAGGPGGIGAGIVDGTCVWNYAGPRGITLPTVRGWEYVWVRYQRDVVGTEVAPVPMFAYVERVYDSADFTAIGIGA